MTALCIIAGAIVLFFLIEYLFYVVGFGKCIYFDITKGAEKMRPALIPYMDIIWDGIRFANESLSELVEVTSFDGLKLRGRLYIAENCHGIVIMAHGYRSVAENDFSCAIPYIYNKGYSVLLIDQRAHKRSEGKTITFGVKEQHDIHTWADYICDRFPDYPVIIQGMSMGTSSVLMAAAEKFPDNVCGLMLDCGYTSPREIICKVLKQYHVSPKLIYPLGRLAARMYGGFDPDSASALESAGKATLPALFVHGEADDFVPCDMGRRNYEAYAGEKELVTVQGADHGLSYLVDMPKVQTAMEEFLNKNMCKK